MCYEGGFICGIGVALVTNNICGIGVALVTTNAGGGGSGNK